MSINLTKKISASVLLILILLTGSCASTKVTDSTKTSSTISNASVSYEAKLAAQTI